MNSTKTFPLPTGYFGIPLGLAVLSLAWLHLENHFPVARTISDQNIIAQYVFLSLHSFLSPQCL